MIKWMVTVGALTLIHNAGATIHPTYVVGKNAQTVTSIQDARDKVPGSSAKVIIADVEHWKLTPETQQKHPAWAIQRICSIAHAHHKQCMAAPAMDLFTQGLKYSQVTPAAKFADEWEVQSQSLELHPRRFLNFLKVVK